jgi:hypothetical protein
MAAVLTNLGEEWAAGCLVQSNALDGHFGHWGSGAGVAAKADVALFVAEAEARVAGAVTLQGAGAAAKWQNIFTLTAAGAKTITNAGCFDALAAGNLLIHWDHGNIVLAVGDQIQYTVTLDPA